MSNVSVAKVGGSLFELPDLADRLRGWFAGFPDRPIIFVPGGGAGADVIRRLDDIHRLGDEAAHWLALGVLSVNARFLAGLLDVTLNSSPSDALAHPVCVLDPYAFCRQDEGRVGSLPHKWEVTSDSIAARAAAVAGGRLILLKSADLPPGSKWEQAAETGLVDRAFPDVVAANGINVSWVNLRRQSLP